MLTALASSSAVVSYHLVMYTTKCYTSDTSLHTLLFTLKILGSIVVPKLVKTSILGFRWGRVTDHIYDRAVGLKSSSRFYRQAVVAGPHQLQCHELTH